MLRKILEDRINELTAENLNEMSVHLEWMQVSLIFSDSLNIFLVICVE